MIYMIYDVTIDHFYPIDFHPSYNPLKTHIAFPVDLTKSIGNVSSIFTCQKKLAQILLAQLATIVRNNSPAILLCIYLFSFIF